MSKETTNKKIKIDNGTTFGRTYTDKAVDELLKNVDSVFDVTPYLTSQTSISVEGYNAVREFVTSNKGGIVKFNMGEYIMYTTCFSVTSDTLTFHHYFVFDSGVYDTTFAEIVVNSNGNVTFNSLPLYQVLANPADSATETLSKIKINGIVYSIPVGEDYSTEISTLNSRVDSLANEVSQYSGSISSLESRVSSLETTSTSYAQASDVSTLDSRVSDIENTVASKSEVSVSSTGTATDTISYITVDGVEKKIDSGSGGGGTTLYKHELMFSDNNHDGDKVYLTIIKTVATPITKFAYSQLIANMVGYYGYKAEKEYPFMSVIGIVSTGTTAPTDERTYIALMQPASGTVGQAMVLGDTAATDTVTEL